MKLGKRTLVARDHHNIDATILIDVCCTQIKKFIAEKNQPIKSQEITTFSMLWTGA